MKTYQLNNSKSLQLKSMWWKARFMARPLFKRVFDIVCALVLLMILTPLFALVAIVIKCDTKGPVFFSQKRVGLGGSHFTMWKFRSMATDAEETKSALEQNNEMVNGVLFKIKLDPRITKVGAIIRKASIDELPQLFNVLKGDMSLVGPRPPLPSEVAKYNRTDFQRLMVHPGITCLWQVCGRSDIPFEKQVELDLQYIESQSLWFDIVLLLKTIPAVLTARGAY